MTTEVLMGMMIIPWLATACFCAYIAHEKNRSTVAWLLLGLLFSFLALLSIGFVPVKAVKEKKPVMRARSAAIRQEPHVVI